MTALFNILAATVLVAAVLLLFDHSPAPAATAAPAIVRAATRAGLVHTGTRTIDGSVQVLSFKQNGCAAPVDILYLPSVTHILPPSRQLIAARARSALVIYDGSVVEDFSFRGVFWRWLRRKLVMAATLAERDPWSSSLIVVLVPPDCPPPPVDWAQFGRHPIGNE